MEFLDIVNENGEPTGMQKERSLVHRDGDLHRTSHVWLVRQRQGRTELLLQKRCPDKDSYPECYDISSAGHIPAGDGFLESAVRELKEELGLDALPFELVYCGTRRICWSDEFHGRPFLDNQVSNVYLLFRDIEAASVRFQESEISEVKWLPMEEVMRRVSSDTMKHCISMEELHMLQRKLEELQQKGKDKKPYFIRRANYGDVPAVIAVEDAAFENMPVKDWYVTDDAAFMERHIEREGFILTACRENRILAFLMVRFPKEAPDSLFCYAREKCRLDDGEAVYTAHMESAAVRPDAAGNGMMRALLAEAEKEAARRQIRYLMATAHPDNLFSRNNLEKQGFEVLTETLKYGGRRRLVYFKEISFS